MGGADRRVTTGKSVVIAVFNVGLLESIARERRYLRMLANLRRAGDSGPTMPIAPE
jgi:hypothetical protein